MVGRLKQAGFSTSGADGRIRGKRNYRWHGKARGGLGSVVVVVVVLLEVMVVVLVVVVESC